MHTLLTVVVVVAVALRWGVGACDRLAHKEGRLQLDERSVVGGVLDALLEEWIAALVGDRFRICVDCVMAYHL